MGILVSPILNTDNTLLGLEKFSLIVTLCAK